MNLKPFKAMSELLQFILGTKNEKISRFVFPNAEIAKMKAEFPNIDFEVLQHDSDYSLIKAEYKHQTDLYNLNQFKQQIYKKQ